MSNKAPRGIRLVITLVGRRNVGKSSLINAITGQAVAIVSNQPGTTTDPVAKHYELLPLGPVTFYDTAGLDDIGEVGELRVKAAQKILLRTDLALVVVGEDGITDYEKEIITRLRDLEIPFLVVFNKNDLCEPAAVDVDYCQDNKISYRKVSTLEQSCIGGLKDSIIELAPEEMKADPLLAGDLFEAGEWVVCVVPIDLSAPKGRLILPQVQVLRDILDNNGVGVTIKEHEIRKTLANLKSDPALVITDSQVVKKVAAEVDDRIPLTTFSTLFARYKGDLPRLFSGAQMIDSLEDGDAILIGEACSHHVEEDDIGRVKIPAWLKKYTGKDLEFEVFAGHDFPEDLERFKLVIHCGGCMLNRSEMVRRIKECNRRGVPITNYGVAISKVQGVLDRVIRPFNL
ncbi:[FeFe] hydrogenase H-cluster maturation GTPase HydF [Maridesulfovibrio hydrothermalis]|uniref:Small GTP-binding protein n=1 Tax=Maridesulfovibrio hydrothermalis AM13 = DSM 14728 TaxID=1121451 RepID=L0RFQ7_9BACT|nr:[FeFe] hydrogenase H-cluster maturation GTPase HydF [Maridesulfovibrio hydrothermalis]CCO25030.1 Small GTP-binding protein [Maridesulfovibrio hydrothermalis AM13 = DSM 14728]